MLHRASEKDAEKGEARVAKEGNMGGKQALDPLSYMGALHQVFLSSRTVFIFDNSITLSPSLALSISSSSTMPVFSQQCAPLTSATQQT
jgi:hypothetical protein